MVRNGFERPSILGRNAAFLPEPDPFRAVVIVNDFDKRQTGQNFGCDDDAVSVGSNVLKLNHQLPRFCRQGCLG